MRAQGLARSQRTCPFGYWPALAFVLPKLPALVLQEEAHWEATDFPFRSLAKLEARASLSDWCEGFEPGTPLVNQFRQPDPSRGEFEAACKSFHDYESDRIARKLLDWAQWQLRQTPNQPLPEA